MPRSSSLSIWKSEPYMLDACLGNYGTPVRRTKSRNLNKCTFRNYGTPVRRTKRRKFHKMHFQKLWDSCAQNKTSEISQNALSGIMGLLCAEQNAGNLKTCSFRNSGTPVRRTKRQTYKQMHFHNFWDSCAQNKTSETQQMKLHRVWDACAQSKTSEI